MNWGCIRCHGVVVCVHQVAAAWFVTDKGDNLPPLVNLGELFKSVPVLEIHYYFVIHDEPLKVLLKYAVSVTTAEFVDDCIQTRFGSVGLPTPVKDTNESISNLSNFVSMQIHCRDAIFSGNRGVGVAPILVAFDGVVHECFDLTHVVKNE